MLNETCPIAFLSRFRPNNLTAAADEAWNSAEALEHALPASVALAVTLLVGSCLVLFFGKKLVRPTLFIAAFGFAAATSFFFVDSVLMTAGAALPPMPSCLTLSIVPLVVGLLAGSLALCCLNLGFFVLGASAGAGLGQALYTAGLHSIPSPMVGEYSAVYIASLSVGALVGALLMCKAKEGLLIVATSCVGAAGTTSATAMLLAHANVRFLGPVRVTAAPTDGSSPFIWSQAVFFFVAMCLGVLVQSRMEARGVRKARTTTALRPATVPLITP